MSSTASRPIVNDGWLMGIAAFLVVWCFYPSLSAGFVFDDEEYIQKNGMVRQGLTRSGVIWAFTAFHASNWHPLTWLSLQLDASLYGDDPLGFHATNIALHAATVALTYLVFRRYTGDRWASFALALLFGLHPLRVESVTWISERKDVLSGLFGMLTLLTYRRYVDRPGRDTMCLVVFSYVLGIMAKPVLVTLPFLLLLLDWWPLARIKAVADLKGLILEKWPLFTIVVLSIVLTVMAQSRGGAVQSFDRVPLNDRILAAPVTTVVYLGMTCYPIDLCVFYPLPPSGRSMTQSLIAAALIVTITWIGYRLRVHAPYVLVGWLWYLGTLIPTIGIVQVGGQAYADRYTYWPHLGLFLAVVWSLRAVDARLMILGSFLSIILLAVLTIHQQKYWINSETLWRHTLAVAPVGNATAHTNLGVELAKQDRHEEALHHFHLAVEGSRTGDPVRLMALNKIAQLSFLMQKYNDAFWAASQVTAQPAARAGETANCWFILGELARFQHDMSRAEQCYHQSIQSEEGWNARLNLGLLLQELGRTEDSLQNLRRAVELGPDVPECQHALGMAYADQERWVEAFPHFVQAVELRPESTRYRGSLAVAYHALGQKELAAKIIQDTIHRDPHWLEWCYQMAWEWATHPDAQKRNGRKALWFVTTALLMSQPPDPLLLDAWAAAAAECGQFDEAITIGTWAAKRASELGSPAKDEIQNRTELYRRGQPYRSTPE